MANGILEQLNQSLELTQEKGRGGSDDVPQQMVSASELLATPLSNNICENSLSTKPATNSVPE